YYFLFYGRHSHYLLRFGIYLVAVGIQYLTLYLFSEKEGWVWVAAWIPIAILAGIRYVPNSVYVAVGHSLGINAVAAPALIGISYMAFRNSLLALEVRNGVVSKPGFWRYLGF